MKTDKNELNIVDLENKKENLLEDFFEEDFEGDFELIQNHIGKIGKYLTYIEEPINDLFEIELKIEAKKKKLTKLIKQWKKGDCVRILLRKVFYTGLVIRYENEKETVVLFDDDNKVTTVEDKNIEFFKI